MTWATIRKAQPEDTDRSNAAADRFIRRHGEELRFANCFLDTDIQENGPIYAIELSLGDVQELDRQKYLGRLWRNCLRRALREPARMGSPTDTLDTTSTNLPYHGLSNGRCKVPQPIKTLTPEQQRTIDHVRTRFFWKHHRELTILAEGEADFPALVREIGQIDAMFVILADQTRVLPIYLLATLRQEEREALDEVTVRPTATYWS